MSFIGDVFEEQLTHEGILDIFKGKSIKLQTTPADLEWLVFSGDLEFIQKGYYYLSEEDVEIPVHLDDIDDLIDVNNKYLKSKNTRVIVIDKDYDGRFNKGEDRNYWSKEWNKEVITTIKNGLSFKYDYDSINMGLKTYSKDSNIVKKLQELKSSLQKVEANLKKNTKIVPDSTAVTTESALTTEEVTTETATNLSGVLELIKARDELETLSQSLTTESGFTFVTKVKDFFVNTIREIENKLSNIFSQQDITLKYQEDKIKELKLLTNICSRLGSIKFSQIEYIELPIMMGMKPNYNQTVFELNNLIASFKGATEQIEDLNNLLSNLIVDKDDIRISNNPKLYKFAREILDTRNKTTRIINEITETKQPVDVKQAGKLFNNLGSIKDINVSYINLYQETIKFDIGKYVTGINRLSTLLTAWIDSVNDRDSEVKYSSNVISIVQDNVSNIANITTNLGIYIAYLNQTSAFFATDVNMLSEKI